MDLREVLKTDPQRVEATLLLDYQPFIIADDVQTGAAHGWVYGDDPRTKPQLIFRRSEETEENWHRITDSNARLRRMYDDFIGAIVDRFPGASYLDLACNNGYFPVRASQAGMRPAVGADGDFSYREAVRFLNRALGTHAQFKGRFYDSRLRRARWIGRGLGMGRFLGLGRYDVVSLVAILCHLPDPLGFLAYAGSRAKEAIFFMGQVFDSDAMLIGYQQPHRALGTGERFPFRFNDNTRLSRGLLFHSLEQMGFSRVVELPWRDEWLPPRFRFNLPPEPHEPDARLAYDLKHGSRHIAVLGMRP